jgi:hypothetical protein
MNTFSKLRRWANRDDGRLIQVGNEAISFLSLFGVFALGGALVVGQLQLLGSASAGWATVIAITGAGMLIVGVRSRSRERQRLPRKQD